MDSKMKMVKGKDGKMVPAFAADGKGKMANGGMMKAKMMANGGMAPGPRMPPPAQVLNKPAMGGPRMPPPAQVLNKPAMAMKKGGMASKMKPGGGVHKMPDGKMMKNSAMKTMKKARG